MAAGEAALKTRPADGREVEIGRLKAKPFTWTKTAEQIISKLNPLNASVH